MKLTVLVDNNTYIDQYYWGEPAVSYYVEMDGCNILFDTGYSDLFLKNAEKMGIDLGTVTHIVLSHGHNDHSNGLQFLDAPTNLPLPQLIAHPHCFLPKQIGAEWIGAPVSADQAAHRFSFVPAVKPYSLSEHCVFLGEIPQLNDYEGRNPFGTTVINGMVTGDTLLDDSALVCKTKEGLFIIAGCAHSGICNTVEYARRVCGEERVAGVIGGFHLFETDERLQKTIAYFNRISVKALYPCHCVSLRVKCEMAKKLDLTEVGVGLQLELP